MRLLSVALASATAIFLVSPDHAKAEVCKEFEGAKMVLERACIRECILKNKESVTIKATAKSKSSASGNWTEINVWVTNRDTGETPRAHSQKHPSENAVVTFHLGTGYWHIKAKQGNHLASCVLTEIDIY